MSMFKERLFSHLSKTVTQAIIVQINKDRKGEQINREVVKNCIQVFVDMGLIKPKPMRTPQGNFLWQGDRNLSIYDDHFENAFLV